MARVSRKTFLEIQAISECRFTLNANVTDKKNEESVPFKFNIPRFIPILKNRL